MSNLWYYDGAFFLCDCYKAFKPTHVADIQLYRYAYKQSIPDSLVKKTFPEKKEQNVLRFDR